MSYKTASGAQRSEKAAGFHMIPATAIRREARRMDKGAAGHGEYNWQKGIAEPAWVVECFNHLIEHALKFRAGEDLEDDHLAAIRCGAAFLMVTEERHPDAIRAAFRNV